MVAIWPPLSGASSGTFSMLWLPNHSLLSIPLIQEFAHHSSSRSCWSCLGQLSFGHTAVFFGCAGLVASTSQILTFHTSGHHPDPFSRYIYTMSSWITSFVVTERVECTQDLEWEGKKRGGKAHCSTDQKNVHLKKVYLRAQLLAKMCRIGKLHSKASILEVHIMMPINICINFFCQFKQNGIGRNLPSIKWKTQQEQQLSIQDGAIYCWFNVVFFVFIVPYFCFNDLLCMII